MNANANTNGNANTNECLNVECCWTAKFDFAPWDTKRTLLIEPCGKRQLYSEGFGLGFWVGFRFKFGYGLGWVWVFVVAISQQICNNNKNCKLGKCHMRRVALARLLFVFANKRINKYVSRYVCTKTPKGV